MPINQRKEDYFARLQAYLDKYDKILMVGADNVGSHQMQQIRIALRGRAELLMGKNTLIRKCIRLYNEEKGTTKFAQLVPAIRGNLGFVFTKEDLGDIRDVLLSNRVPAAAKAGAVAPLSVTVPAGPTGMEPTQTAVLQALNIATKIVKGQVEIINPCELITAGDKVTPSQAALLQKLDIRPFTYGLSVEKVFDQGFLYDASVLDITENDVLNAFAQGVRNLACVSLAISHPTIAALPHLIANGYKNLLAVCMEIDWAFPKAQELKDILSDPEALAKMQAAAASSAPAAAAEEKVEEKKEEEEEEESDEDMGFGLFD